MNESSIAAAKGIQPCPLCGSADVRWRSRRPTDFALTWMRYLIEWIWSAGVGKARLEHRRSDLAKQGFIDTASLADLPEVQAEIREANTGHKTPKLFWRCTACHQEGHVF